MKSPRSSRQRYNRFVGAYRDGTLDQQIEAEREGSGPRREPGKRKEYLRDYLKWLWPHRWATAAVFVLAVSAAAVDMISPLFMRTIIDKVLLVTGVGPAERLSRLHLIGGAFLFAVIANGLLGAWKDYRQRILNVKVILALRQALFRRLLHLPLPRLWEMKTGGILSRLTGDVETTTGLLQMAIVSPAISLIRLIIAIGILTALNWRLALMALAVVPGVIVVSFIATRRIRPIYRSVRKDVEEIDGRVGETFGGIRVVRAFRRELWELFGYLRGRHTVLRKELFAHRRELVIWTTWGLLVGAVNVVIVWYGGWLNIQGRATVGDIMAFQWYTFLLLNPIWNLVNTFSELQRSLAAMERVFEVLSWEDEKPDRPGARAAPARVDEFRFEGVEFAYREGRPVVREFDVTVPGGSVVALVGRSGAGKTTVTDLVARFHDPSHGRILMNGTDLRDLTLGSYRDLLAVVQQDVFLFDGSVRENIAYGGSGDMTDAMVEDAARRANAHEFILALPDGYDTLIGERGVKLSGGQRQRLAIARAILADPRILILDEATSNLDTESEQLIQAAMADLLAGRTTFVIAHRLSTVRRADLILLLDEGRIVERGTHDELMALRGTYYEMVQRQAEAAAESGSAALGGT